MKNLLGLVLLALVCSITPASSAGLYVEAFGGYNWNSVNIDNGHVVAKDEEGYAIGAAVGTKVASVPGLSVEAELSYRSNDIGTTICDTPLIVTDETWALMGNASYELPVQAYGVRPYVLAGIGYGSRTAAVDYTNIGVSNTGLAWQVGAGLKTDLADGVTLGIGYRYFDAPDLDVAPTGGFHDAGNNQSLIASMEFALN